MAHRRNLLLLSVLGWAVALGTTAVPFSAADAQTVQAPGGFLEKAGTTIRSRWSNAQVQNLVPPDRGKFLFPAPYNTQAVRLTSPTDCPPGIDCLWYVGYSYWRNTNNHVGSNQMLIFLSFNKNVGGAGPTLLTYDKTTDTVTNVRPLFDVYSPWSWKTAEGWYFSATRPNSLYVNDGPSVYRYDVVSKEFELVYDATTAYGTDRYIWQMHSSNDDAVHSATLRRTSTGEDLGCLIYRETTKQFLFFAKVDKYDECHIDKSGRYLLIQEVIGTQPGLANRFIDIETGIETRLLDAAGTGTLGHHDLGFGYIVGGDRWNSLPNATSVNFLNPTFSKGPTVNKNYNWDISQVNHMTHANAKSGTPVDQQFACGSNADRVTYNQNEVVCFRLNNSLDQLIVAPIMTDMNAGGGGNDYAKCPKGNLDITGQYFLWTSNLGTGRLEAFIVKVPYQVLYGQAPVAPSDPTATPLPPGKGRGKKR